VSRSILTTNNETIEQLGITQEDLLSQLSTLFSDSSDFQVKNREGILMVIKTINKGAELEGVCPFGVSMICPGKLMRACALSTDINRATNQSLRVSFKTLT
jgi:hypothetical protein